MRSTFVFLVLITAIIVVGWYWFSARGSYANAGKPQTEGEKVVVIGVVAPPYEPSFEQRYNVKLDLPMDEDEFLDLVEGLELDYYGAGPDSMNMRNKAPGLDMPWEPVRTRNYDMSTISHSYTISEKPDRGGRRQVSYLALVSNDREVVYIENRFAYTSF